MIRLTGRHPFNAEAKLQDLFSQGFITPSSLFFVRNHGAVPEIDPQMANDWKLKIHGLVCREGLVLTFKLIDLSPRRLCSRPGTFTLEDLRKKFRVITIPVTLVCAGNRRKEQNVVRKSLGFSWGAAGISTALFTGVYLADVLEYILPQRGAKHVIFEGNDDLPNGPYGTRYPISYVFFLEDYLFLFNSQLLSWAQDRRKGMMLAWGMNGLPYES